ncbi:MAG: DNA polymerase III subunit alpha [Limosilactobacillus sp.]|uniref:DNA polymerase III subunit alpha n=1 Tax=Limosilactobacillus sp. TaxID=2773925 RepID=UPI0027030CDA|nr:DNA polymerase III subunit alpha [Limosilactobacillus sp.]
MKYVPLQVHSCFSLLKSPIRINDLVQTALDRGYSALALTDQNVLYGAVDFYNAAKKAGIKPLIGLEIIIQVDNADGTRVAITLIAKTQIGYQHLMDLSTLQQTRERDQLPLTITDISPYLSDLVMIIPAQSGLLNLLLQGDSWLTEFTVPLRAESLYLGVNLQLDTVQRQSLQKFADDHQLGVVATTPVEYLNSTDLFATKTLQAIGQGAQLEDIEAQSKARGSHFLAEESQVAAEYERAGMSEALANTVKIAKECNVEMKFSEPVLPKFATPDGLTAGQYLRKLCLKGLSQRNLAPGFTSEDYMKRLNRELKVIHEMGFDDYFLIVWDVMNFAHQHQITTDPGRGSAAGSLVAYALAITEVDPLEYQLLFERFLNPERAQMPDIDLDIPDNRREEVLAYVHEKYGHKRVAQIITFGTLASKQVIRDLTRVFDLSRYEADSLTDALPRTIQSSLRDTLAESQRLQNLLNDQPKLKLLYDVAQRLEGLPRHYSIHAAGIVLSEQPLHEIVPLQTGSEGILMTQFPKDTVEALGLLKMDFLGLRNLSIMDNTIQEIRKRQPNFDLRQVKFNDPATIKLFQDGLTDGIFQFESTGIRNVLTSLRPDRFEDIVAVNALYRPGPMENIPHFIARKHGQEAVKLPDPSLEPILGKTYGILVYQEQVMQLASAMAGFTLGEADLLRRAMSKKKKQTMESMRAKFLQGAAQKGYPTQLATQVFNYIDQFANYGFNRSHAVAYSMMAFQMAYLKCHFPAEFYTSLLNAESNVAKLRQHITNAQKLGLNIHGPRINQSQAGFTEQDSQIYFGFSAIKGNRRDFTAEILREREENCDFKDIKDFVNRMPEQMLHESYIEPLIYVGAFDGLGYNRAEMINALPGLLSGVQLFGKTDDPSLLTKIAESKEYSLTERLAKESEYLGVYLSGHPVSQFSQLATRVGAIHVNQMRPNQKVTLIIFTNRIKTIHTKKDHRQMAFVSGSDETGIAEVTVFPKQFNQYSDLLDHNKVLVITGRTEERQGHGTQLIAQTIQDAGQLRNKLLPTMRWVLRVDSEHNNPEFLNSLRQFMTAHKGNVPVLLYYPDSDEKILEPTKRWMNTQRGTEAGLCQILGKENVVLQKLEN